LTRMHAAGLLAVERHGRHRYYRLACPHLGTLTELLAQLAPRRPVRSLRGARAASGLSLARTCYDHLAGDIGVAVCESLQTLRVITISDGRVGLGHRHDDLLTKQLGVDLHAFRGDRRRPDARLCLDWTARRHHLAGALGAALTHRLVELGWLHRHPSTRALAITSNGWAGFETYFGITKEQLAEDVIRLPA
ncbi:MAG: transcriptional regulator, partial [Acetobacteraceae bacterium]|nr:transcriptional regulator [Acetobacteraceae bacterium]